MKQEKHLNTSTFIHQDTVLTAEISSQGSLHVSGTIHGNAEVKSLAMIDHTGKIIGNLLADEAKISGIVEGDLHIKNTLTLLSTAKIQGNIIANNLVSESGAQIEGLVKISPKASVSNAFESGNTTSSQKKAS